MYDIPKIMVVSMSSSMDRREHMERVLSRLEVEYEYIDAVDGKRLNKHEVESCYESIAAKECIGRDLTAGELGCALSHKKIYQRMLKENISEVVVLEDDVALCEDFVKILRYRQQFPKNWELVLLGHGDSRVTGRGAYSCFFGKKHLFDEYHVVCFPHLAYGTVGYIINLAGARRLLEQLNWITMPIDHLTGSRKHIEVYGIEPFCVEEDSCFGHASLIAQERNEKQRMRIGWYRLANTLRTSRLKRWLKWWVMLPKRICKCTKTGKNDE